MAFKWSDKLPIYKQLRQLIVERILDGSFVEGGAIPSVRQVSADLQINHLTVAKTYQQLVDAGFLEKRRGLGMFVVAGARSSLADNERQIFLNEELPNFAARVRVLGINIAIVTQALLETREDN